MIELLDLKELGVRLRKVDQHLIALLAKRMNLALQVEEFKQTKGQPIYRPKIEDERLQEVRKWAQERGLNPNFAQALLYLIIDESCKVQADYLQQTPERKEEPQDEEAWYQNLKQNLLALTAKVAPIYDERYHKTFFATHSYLEFEQHVLDQELALLKDRSLLIDLGCATGRMTFRLAHSFDRVVGYDISPEMIYQARKKLKKANFEHMSFEVVDIECGIPQEDKRASLIVMNLGTASDLRNIKHVLIEAQRVMKPESRIFLSFYNANALLYRWEFIPWPVSLAAEINLTKHCLDVHCGSEGVFSVYARPYTTKEIRSLFPKGIKITQILTHPTIGSVLPNDIFEEKAIRESIVEIDRKLAELDSGAYILVMGKKIA